MSSAKSGERETGTEMKGPWKKAAAHARPALLPGLLLCVLLAPGGAAAQDYSAGAAGTTGTQFLKVAAGARGAALGEAYSAYADDAFALDWNPAGLINISNKSLVFMHAPYLAESYADYIAYGENTGEMGAWGVAAKQMNFGEIRRTDSSGLDTGTFTPYDVAMSVGLACYVTGFNFEPEERFVLGATGKFVRSKISSSDSTISADIGLLTPLMLDGTFRMGLSAQNIMGSLRFDKEETQLPLTVRLGNMMQLYKHFTLTVDLVAARDNLPYLATGGEARISADKDMDIFLRAGFNTRAVSDLGGTHNIALGAGLRYSDYRLDYAFSPFGDLGSVHRISVSMTFKEKKPAR